jgi:transcriptional regulator with XRE-family HTH domain
MQTTLGERLKKFRKAKRIIMAEIADATGISVTNLYKWEAGVKPRDYNLYRRLEEYLDKMEKVPDIVLSDAKANYLDGRGNVAASLISISLTNDEEPQLYTKDDVNAGTITIINGKPVLIAYRNDSLAFNEADGLITVHDDCAEPKIKSGSLITIKRLKHTLEGYWAGCYYLVIDKCYNKFLRRLFPVKDKSILLLSENPTKYPDIQVDMDDLLVIFKVEKTIINL